MNNKKRSSSLLQMSALQLLISQKKVKSSEYMRTNVQRIKIRRRNPAGDALWGRCAVHCPREINESAKTNLSAACTLSSRKETNDNGVRSKYVTNCVTWPL